MAKKPLSVSQIFFVPLRLKELLETQIMAKRSKWHSCQVITSKSGNSPKILCIRHEEKYSKYTQNSCKYQVSSEEFWIVAPERLDASMNSLR